MKRIALIASLAVVLLNGTSFSHEQCTIQEVEKAIEVKALAVRHIRHIEVADYKKAEGDDYVAAGNIEKAQESYAIATDLERQAKEILDEIQEKSK